MRVRALILVAIASALMPGTAGAGQEPTEDRVLASVEGRWEHMFCDLTGLSRSAPGELMVRFRYRNTASEQVTFPLLANIVSDTRVLDTDNRIVYGALEDTAGNVLGSSTQWNVGSGHLKPGSSQAHWVKVQAPPDSVTAVTVLVPSCLPMEGVSIDGEPTATPMTSPKPAIASQETQNPGLVVELVELGRAPGAVVNAIVRYRNTGEQRFTFPHMTELVRQFYLIDPQNRQKHPVVQDADREPICGRTLELSGAGGERIDPGRAINLWAKLSAPAEDVTTASLTVHGAPPFDNVTIEGQGSGTGAGDAVAGTAIGLEAALEDLGARVSDAEIRIDLAADVLFDFDEAELKPEAAAELEKLATVITAQPDAQVTIDGHTDNVGADDYNQTLSEQRAAAVKDWLTANSEVDPATITTRGLGEAQPVAHNTKPDGSDDPEGRAKNRRVEVTVRKGAPSGARAADDTRKAQHSSVENNVDQALADADEALRRNPNDPEAHHNRGVVYSLQGRYEDALAALAEAIRLAPGAAAESHHTRGRVYLAMGDADAAIAAFDAALTVDPRHVDALISRGGARQLGGNADGAMADYDAALAIDAQNAVALSNRGSLFLTTSRFDEAIADLDRSIELDARNGLAYLNRALARFFQRQFQAAMPDFDRAVELEPENADYYFQRGSAYAVQGRIDRAIADLGDAIRLSPEGARAYALRGALLEQLGRRDEAIADQRKALALEPANARAAEALRRMRAKS